MVPLTVSSFTEKGKKCSSFFFKLISLFSSLSTTYLGVIEACEVEKSSADKSPFYWQIMKFFLKLAQSLMFSFSPSILHKPPIPSLYFLHICHFFLNILWRSLGLDFNISNLINLLNFHKP